MCVCNAFNPTRTCKIKCTKSNHFLSMQIVGSWCVCKEHEKQVLSLQIFTGVRAELYRDDTHHLFTEPTAANCIPCSPAQSVYASRMEIASVFCREGFVSYNFLKSSDKGKAALQLYNLCMSPLIIPLII